MPAAFFPHSSCCLQWPALLSRVRHPEPTLPPRSLSLDLHLPLLEGLCSPVPVPGTPPYFGGMAANTPALQLPRARVRGPTCPRSWAPATCYNTHRHNYLPPPPRMVAGLFLPNKHTNQPAIQRHPLWPGKAFTYFCLDRFPSWSCLAEFTMTKSRPLL